MDGFVYVRVILMKDLCYLTLSFLSFMYVYSKFDNLYLYYHIPYSVFEALCTVLLTVYPLKLNSSR